MFVSSSTALNIGTGASLASEPVEAENDTVVVEPTTDQSSTDNFDSLSNPTEETIERRPVKFLTIGSVLAPVPRTNRLFVASCRASAFIVRVVLETCVAIRNCRSEETVNLPIDS